MVKALKDLCLYCIEHSLDKIPNLEHNLPTLYKEILIERLSNHDMFHPLYRPFIFANLFCENLRYLHLYRSDQVDDECLVAVSRSRCQLEVIAIHKCVNVTDTGILAVTSGQSVLRKLELKKLPNLTGHGLTQVASPCLWKAEFRGCSSLDVAGVATLIKKNPSIKQLLLADCPKIDEKIFSVVATTLNSSLEQLETQLHTLTDENVLYLAYHCPNLKKLDCCGCTRIGKDSLIKLFQGCTHLDSLDLSYCNRLRSPPENEVLWTLPQTLKELSLCGLLLEDETIFVECLQRLHSLTSIRLCGVSALNDNTLTQILQHIGQDLTTLDVSGGVTCRLTDAGLTSVATYCTNLESLSLSLLTLPTGASLTPILAHGDRALLIHRLALSCYKIDIDFLFTVATMCRNLEHLDLAGLRCVTDDLLTRVARNCSSVTHLSIKGCLQVTDAGLCELARCCPLRSLVVSGINNLTDRSIFALANGNPYLEEIYLNGCSRVTPMAVQYLVDCCIPRLYCQHCVPNAGPSQLMAKNLDTGEFCRADLLSTS